MLYEFWLKGKELKKVDRNRIFQKMEEVSLYTVRFAEASFGDCDSTLYEALSPSLPYSLYQAALIQYHFWRQKGDFSSKARFDSIVSILGVFRKRWMIAGVFCAWCV
jgi:hypothetical protein